MPEINRSDNFEPERSAAQLAMQGLVRCEAHGITFYTELIGPLPASEHPVCPACEEGDHEQPALVRCDCACHGEQRPGARSQRNPPVIDYERLGFELAVGAPRVLVMGSSGDLAELKWECEHAKEAA